MKEVVIVSACRTPIGSFGGSLKSVSAADLGAITVKEAIKRAGIAPEQVEEVVYGNVLQAGLGQNVARQVSIKAGLPVETTAVTINIVCGSGLKTVAMAAQAIKAGDADIIVAGGTENMSAAPYVLPSARWGARMNNSTMVDAMVNDGLWDAFNQYHMGITAENVAAQWGITREEQDAFAVRARILPKQQSKPANLKMKLFLWKSLRRRVILLFLIQTNIQNSAHLLKKWQNSKPAFKKDGTVTAANASGINDGAAALVVMSKEKAQELGLNWLCEVVAYATGGVDPSIMGVGPIASCTKALAKADMTIDDIDLVEANEAFAAQSIAVARDLKFNMDKVNVNGGAIALGHPIGDSGARILVTLIYEMMKRDSKTGLATLCIGGGQGQTMIIKR